MEHVARGMRGLSSAQNELTLGLWTFRSQHLHPGLFHICVCPQIISSFETECVKYGYLWLDCYLGTPKKTQMYFILWGHKLEPFTGCI